jgi:hypothetical protein
MGIVNLRVGGESPRVLFDQIVVGVQEGAGFGAALLEERANFPADIDERRLAVSELIWQSAPLLFDCELSSPAVHGIACVRSKCR